MEEILLAGGRYDGMDLVPEGEPSPGECHPTVARVLAVHRMTKVQERSAWLAATPIPLGTGQILRLVSTVECSVEVLFSDSQDPRPSEAREEWHLYLRCRDGVWRSPRLAASGGHL